MLRYSQLFLFRFASVIDTIPRPVIGLFPAGNRQTVGLSNVGEAVRVPPEKAGCGSRLSFEPATENLVRRELFQHIPAADG